MARPDLSRPIRRGLPTRARAWRACVSLACIALACVSLASCSSGGKSESGSSTVFDGAVLPPGVRAHDFTLVDQYGRRVSLADYRGRVRLLAFLSASQRSSQLVAQQIRGALDELGSRAGGVATLIVSIDPHPSRVQAERFLQATSLAGRALYLTGPKSRLRAIWKQYGVVPASAGEQAFLASTPIVLVDRAGVERVGFAVEQLTPEGLAHDLRALLGA